MASENNFVIEVLRKNSPPIYIHIDSSTANREINREYLFQACQQYDHVTAEEFEQATINICTSEQQPVPSGSGESEPLCYFSARDSSSGGHWSQAAVKCLLGSYSALQNKFQCPDTMKREAWAMVAALMKKKGFSLTGSECDRKMRCLKFRYRLLSDKRTERGEEGGRRWEHMEDMEELMAGIPAEDSALSLSDLSPEMVAGVADPSKGMQEAMGGQSSGDVPQPTTPVIRRVTLNPGGGHSPQKKSKDSASFAKAIGEDLESLMGISSFSGPQWTSESVRVLIATFKDLQRHFQCPDILKRQAWEMVADTMATRGFPVTGWQCDEKMRNLRYRHKKICEKRDTGWHVNRWEHLAEMDDLMKTVSAMEEEGGAGHLAAAGDEGRDDQDQTDKMITGNNTVSGLQTSQASGSGPQTGTAREVSGSVPRTSASGSTHHWNAVSTKCLIRTCIKLQSKFHSRQLKKKGAWELVAKALRAKGYPLTGADCDVKMRNMRFRHRRVLETNTKKGKAGKVWQYMAEMDALVVAEQKAEADVKQRVKLIGLPNAANPEDGGSHDSEACWDQRQQQQEGGSSTEDCQSDTDRAPRHRGRKKKSDGPPSSVGADSDGGEPRIFRARISHTGSLCSPQAIQCLISTYKALRGEFNCPKLKKRDAWKQVAAIMRRNGYSVTGLQCDNKMRYLRYRHKRRDARRQKFGGGILRYWEHMNAMDDLIAMEQGRQAGGKGGTRERSDDIDDSDEEEPGEDMQDPAADESESLESKPRAAPRDRGGKRKGGGASSFDGAGRNRKEHPPRSSSGAQWTPRAVKCLIALYRALQEDFRCPYTKKKQAWAGLAAAMKKRGYCDVTGPLCNDKMRNLRFRHRQIKEKLRREGGEGQTTWEHMEDMDDLESGGTTPVTPVALIKVNNADMSSDEDDDDNDDNEDDDQDGDYEKVGEEPQESTGRRAAGMVREVEREGGQRQGETSRDPSYFPKDEEASDDNAELLASLGFQWSTPAVKCLIRTYRRVQHLFTSEDCREKEAWLRVANIMTQKDYPLTGPQCDDKMRNLKSRHRRISQRRKSQKGQVRWEYMADMDRLVAVETGAEPGPPLTDSQGEGGDEAAAKEDNCDSSPVKKRRGGGKGGGLEGTTIEATVTHQLSGTPVVRLVPLKFTGDILVPKRSLRRREGGQQVTMAMDGEEYAQWQQVKLSQHLDTDSQVAAFLLGSYAKSQTDRESGRNCSRCQRLLPGTCAQGHGQGQGQVKGHQPPPTTSWSLLNPQEGVRKEGEDRGPPWGEASSLTPGPDGGVFREVGNVLSAHRLANVSDSNALFTNLHPVTGDQIREGRFSLLGSPGKQQQHQQAPTALQGGAEIRTVGEAFPVQLFQVDDVREVRVGAMFTNCARQSNLVAPPTARQSNLVAPPTTCQSNLVAPPTTCQSNLVSTPTPCQSNLVAPPTPCQSQLVAPPTTHESQQSVASRSVRQELGKVSESVPPLPESDDDDDDDDNDDDGGGDDYDDGEETEVEDDKPFMGNMLPETSGERGETSGERGETSGEQGERPEDKELDTKEALDISLSMLSRVLHQKRPRTRAPRRTWGLPPYLCQQCGESFDKSSNLVRHIYKHTGEYPYPCPDCSSGFVTKTELDQHYRRHTGEKPFLCPKCGTAYSRSCNLETHLRTHTGERPYPCAHCPARFTTSSARGRHQRMHTGEKPYVCTQCNAAFQQLNMLKLHQYHHTGIRAHQCPKCGMAFYTRAGLLRHNRKVQCTKR